MGMWWVLLFPFDSTHVQAEEMFLKRWYLQHQSFLAHQSTSHDPKSVAVYSQTGETGWRDCATGPTTIQYDLGETYYASASSVSQNPGAYALMPELTW